MGTFSVHPSDDEIRPERRLPGKPDGERPGVGEVLPAVVAQRPQKVADRLDQTPVRRLRKGEPTTGLDLPVIDPCKTLGGEGVERFPDEAEEVSDFDDLSLADQRFHLTEDREGRVADDLVLEIDFQMDVMERSGPLATPDREAADRPVHNRGGANQIRGGESRICRWAHGTSRERRGMKVFCVHTL